MANKVKPKKTPLEKDEAKTSYATLDVKLVSYMYRKGATDQEVADELGVCRRTIDNWKAKHPEFLQSVRSWKEEADEEVERSLFERAKGYSHKETKLFCHEGMIVSEEVTKHYAPDTTACIFWLKNRKPQIWRDRHEVAQTNTNMTVEEFLKLNEKGDK